MEQPFLLDAIALAPSVQSAAQPFHVTVDAEASESFKVSSAVVELTMIGPALCPTGLL